MFNEAYKQQIFKINIETILYKALKRMREMIMGKVPAETTQQQESHPISSGQGRLQGQRDTYRNFTASLSRRVAGVAN